MMGFGKLMRIPPRLGVLLAAGTGICGVTAIVSVAPAIDADEKEVAYAIANITIFGLLGMLVYPYVASMLLHTSEQIGLFLGTAVHDTSQVMGAAITYKELYRDEITLQTAVVTKLMRNLLMAAVLPLLSLYYLRRQNGVLGSAEALDVGKIVPMFVIGFVAMAIMRSFGDASLRSGLAFGIWDVQGWKRVTNLIGEVWGAHYLLGTAMAGVGLGTNLSAFKGIGFRPFAIGFIGALAVGLVGMLMAMALGPLIKL
jgi:uncharacterized membrane protein YadS